MKYKSKQISLQCVDDKSIKTFFKSKWTVCVKERSHMVTEESEVDLWGN